MNELPFYAIDTANVSQISRHLYSCDKSFVVSLTSRVELRDYAFKIVRCATRFEAWYDNALIGLVAAYFNDKSLTAFITNVSVTSSYKRMGIGRDLLHMCLKEAANKKIDQLQLQVEKENLIAIAFYKKFGFSVCSLSLNSNIMSLQLKDWNVE